MLYIPQSEQGLKNHYAGVKRRLGLTAGRMIRRTSIPGVNYEYRGKHHRPDHEFLLIEQKGPPVELTFEDGDEYQPAWKVILREVAEAHGLEPRQLRVRSRDREIVMARHEACYRLHAETPLSLSQIAAKLGYCDHSPVCHAIRQHKARKAK